MSDKSKAQKRWADLPENLCKALTGVIVIDRGPKHNSTLYLPKDAGLRAQFQLAKYYERDSTHYGSDQALRDTIPSHDVWVYDKVRDETVEYLGLEQSSNQMERLLAAIAIGKASSRYGIRDGYVASAEHNKKTDAEHIAQCLDSRQRTAERAAAEAEAQEGSHAGRLKKQEWVSHSGKHRR